MKTKTNLMRNALSVALITAASALTSQNVTFTADAAPLPGGSSNSAFGLGTLLNNSSGSFNTATGWDALRNNVSGGANNAFGALALTNNVGVHNCAFGTKCMDANATGSSNSAFGNYALNANGTGDFNSGLGYNANPGGSNFVNSTAIGANAVVNASDRVWLGDGAVDVWTQNNYFMVSDGRFKKNVNSDRVKGLDFIKLLRPVTYNLDGKSFNEFITKNMPADMKKNYTNTNFDKQFNILQSGFIAQEVEQAAQTSGYSFSGIHAPNGETDTYGISYQQFVVPLVKAVQEQQQMIEEQKNANQQLTQSHQQLQQDHQQLLQKFADQQKAIDALTAASKTQQGATGISSQSTINSFAMEQNEPNPFTHETLVRYNLPEQSNNAYMAVYDLSGKQIATFALTQKGNGSLTITSEKLSPGIYIYSIVSDGKVFDSKKMIVADK